MGIMDKVTSLLPRLRSHRSEPPAPTDSGALRDDFDRWLQRLSDEPWGFPAVSERGWVPSADVHETDDEVVVTVEVPGLDSDDIDLMITPQGLTIRGEKREERDEKRTGFYVAECRYGTFVRTVPLPSGLDLERAEARVSNGVLTVRFPKRTARPGGRRIQIRT